MASDLMVPGINLNLYENFIESIAQVMSRALTDEETEKLLSSFESLQARLRHLSNENLRRLAAEASKERPFCKHKGTCTANALRGWLKAFGTFYAVKYLLSFVPALITGQIYRKPETLMKIGGKDTISFALFLSVFTSGYRGLLCLFRRLRGKGDWVNAFLAGCISGTSIFLDSNKSRRLMVALYLSTRTGHFICRWFWLRYLQNYIFGTNKAVMALEDMQKKDHIDAFNANLKSKNKSASSTHNNNKHHSHHHHTHHHHRSSKEHSRHSGSGSVSPLVITDGATTPTPTKLGMVSPQFSNSSHQIPLKQDASTSPTNKAEVAYVGPPKSPSGIPEAEEYLDIESDQTVLENKIVAYRAWLRAAGGTLLMMVSSAQILNAYICNPNTINKSYFSFLAVHGGIKEFQPTQAKAYLETMGEVVKAASKGISASFRPVSNDPSLPPPLFEATIPAGLPVERITKYADFISQAPHEYIMCALEHPHHSSCERGFVRAFGKEWWRALSLYVPLNGIMALIFRGSSILKRPKKFIYFFLKSTIRSAIFLTLYCTMAWYTPCTLRRIFKKESMWHYYLNGLISGATVMIEAPGRRLELGMYCLPRAIESFWNCGVEWGWWRNIPGGEGIYFCLATGVLMTLYQQDPEAILDGYRKVMYRFFGIN